jgi:hypothetical protein
MKTKLQSLLLTTTAILLIVGSSESLPTLYNDYFLSVNQTAGMELNFYNTNDLSQPFAKDEISNVALLPSTNSTLSLAQIGAGIVGMTTEKMSSTFCTIFKWLFPCISAYIQMFSNILKSVEIVKRGWCEGG